MIFHFDVVVVKLIEKTYEGQTIMVLSVHADQTTLDFILVYYVVYLFIMKKILFEFFHWKYFFNISKISL